MGELVFYQNNGIIREEFNFAEEVIFDKKKNDFLIKNELVAKIEFLTILTFWAKNGKSILGKL